MPNIEVRIPAVGESISEATIGKWNFRSGDWVEKDVVIFEIETEKATMEVNAPASGKLNISEAQGRTLPIGAVVASIDTTASKIASPPPPPSQVSTKVDSLPPTPKPATAAASANGQAPKTSAPSQIPTDTKGLGPSDRKAIREGRISAPLTTPALSSIEPSSEGVRRVPMSVIRKKIAERLMHSQSSTATLTTFNEVDMGQVLSIRNQLKEKFQAQHNVKLGFMSFFARAIVHAIAQVPVLNAFIDENEVVHHESVHLGVAVSTEKGLVVPVVRNANKKSFSELERDIGVLAEKARVGKLGIDEMMGGTFSLTNGGVFGSLLSTPILNPPQSGILGMHKTEHRPKAIEANGQWSVEIRPMMYLAMSYDHRLVDGKDSVTFLVKVKEYLESISPEEVMRG